MRTDLQRWAGVTTEWDSEDRDAVREHNRQLWAEWKEEKGYARSTPVTEIEGFLASIQALYDYGYSLTDIGVFFGLTRERVRQYFEQHEWLKRYDDGGADFRLWDDDVECFVPVTHDEMDEAMYRAKVCGQRREFAEQRAGIVDAIQDLQREHGRPPTLGEISDRVDRHRVTLAQWWGYSSRKTSRTYTQAWNAMYSDAGIPQRPTADSTKEEGRHWSAAQSQEAA